MQSPNLLTEENVDKGPQKMGYQVRLHPWMPLTTDEEIPVPAEWVVTMVTPVEKIQNMYIEDILNDGQKPDQTSGFDEQSDIGLTD
jgi:hypothetical protein